VGGSRNIRLVVQKARKIEKVTGSQDDDFVVSWRSQKTSVSSDFDVFQNKLAFVGEARQTHEILFPKEQSELR
jgi:hypothetical protein